MRFIAQGYAGHSVSALCNGTLHMRGK